MNATRRSPFEYKWQPVSGQPVSVSLVPSLEAPERFLSVYHQTEHLGDVFQDEWGFWRYRRAGKDEMVGTQLRNYYEACSALLFALRQGGKI